MTKEQFHQLQIGDVLIRTQGRDDNTEQNITLNAQTHWTVQKRANMGKEVHLRKGRYRKIILTIGQCEKFEITK